MCALGALSIPCNSPFSIGSVYSAYSMISIPIPDIGFGFFYDFSFVASNKDLSGSSSVSFWIKLVYSPVGRFLKEFVLEHVTPICSLRGTSLVRFSNCNAYSLRCSTARTRLPFLFPLILGFILSCFRTL